MKGSNITLPSTAAIGEALDNKLDLSSFSSYTSNTYNYISAVNALANSAYTTAVNNYYNKADLSAVSSYSSDLTYLSGACDYLSGQTEQKLDKASADTLYYPLTGNPSGFITGVDLSNYYEKTETSSKEEISSALTGKLDNDFSGNFYPMTGNPSGFLTAHQDLSDYYQKTDTSSKEEISAAIDYVSANAGKTYSGISPIFVNNDEDKISADVWGFLVGTGLRLVEDNENKTTTLELTAQLTGEYLDKASADTLYQPIGNYYSASNPSGFLTAHQDLSDYVTHDDLTAALSGLDDPYALCASSPIQIVNNTANKTTTISITGNVGSQSKYYIDTPAEHTSADVDLTLWVTATQAGYYARRVYAGSDMVGELTPPGSAGSAGQYLGITGSSIRWMDINIPSGAYGVRTEIVATSGDATGTGIVYIVTGNS